MKIPKEIFYEDEINDDFAGKNIKAKKITGKYEYEPKNIFWKSISAFLYRIVATPIGYVYVKLKFGYELFGRDKLKKYKDNGFFLYINHTQTIADVFFPSLVTFPKKSYIIANPDNVSLPILGDITKMLGALPLPGDIESTKKFINVVKNKIKKGNSIAIYPEAHVWQYYTGIRNFKSDAFRYPIELRVPTFSLTITYQKWGKRKRPKIVGYIDGPFFAEEKLKKVEQKEDLRDKVYDAMSERAKSNTVEIIKYSKVVDKTYG